MEGSLFGFDRWHVSVAAIVILLTGLLLFVTSKFTAKGGARRRLPPGPKGWPLVGAIPYLGVFPHRSFYELYKKYGPIMYMRLGSVSTLVVSNAELSREILQVHDQVFASRPLMIIGASLTYGSQDIAWAPYGPHWRLTRKIANLQLLTSAKLGHFLGILKSEILNTIHIVLEESQSEGKKAANVNMTALFSGMAMNVLTQMMWNKRHRNLKGSESPEDHKFEGLVRRVNAVSGANNIADFLPSSLKSLAMKISGLDKEVAGSLQELDGFAETIITDRERCLAKESKDAAHEDDFLTVMLKLKDHPVESTALSREAMKAILVDVLMAGTDSTTITLDWISAELLRHPHMLRKLQDELAAVVGEDRLVSESDIPKLKYLDAVVKETFRVHTPGPLGVPHYSMAESKIGGYDVPINTMVFINMFALHHDPAVWENPWVFNPDRFLNSQLDYKGHHFDFIPFGSGRRICPGMNFASTFCAWPSRSSSTLQLFLYHRARSRRTLTSRRVRASFLVEALPYLSVQSQD